MPDTNSTPTHQNFRHHAARRRAIARLQHEPRTRSWRSPRRSSTWASISSKPAFRSPRRAISRRSARSPTRSAAPIDLRPGPLQRRRHRPRLGGAARSAASRGSTSSWPPAPSIASSSCKMDKEEIIAAGGRRREAGRGLLRRRRVLARRRRPHRARFSLPGRRSGDRSRGDDGQHSRHGRLRHAAAIWRRRSRTLEESRAEHRQGGDQRALPQRSGPGRRQQPGRRSKTAPGRSSARSTASASGPATARWKKS